MSRDARAVRAQVQCEIQTLGCNDTTRPTRNVLNRALVTCVSPFTISVFNPLTPNDDYSGRTAPLTSKRFILYIYSTKTGTEYFKHGIYSPFFPLQNAVCFINLTYLVPVLFTFNIQVC